MVPVKLIIYNAAGELVKSLGTIMVPEPYGGMTAITPQYPAVKTGYDPASGLLTILITFGDGSTVPVTWDGSNEVGKPVLDGEYVLKAEQTAPDGSIATLTAPVIVSRKGASLKVSIYNLAGELVREIYSTTTVKEKISFLDIQGDPVHIYKDGTGTKAQIVPKNINGKTMSDGTGALGSLEWDGRAANGSLVATGEYIVKVEENYFGQTIVITKSVSVVRDQQDEFLKVNAYPNPYHASKGNGEVTFVVNVREQAQVSVRVYNVAGEAVTMLDIPTAQLSAIPSGTVTWNVADVASGVYLGVFEAHGVSGKTEKKVIKVIIVK